MGASKKLTMWYLRISRIFGVFPNTRSVDGSAKFTRFSLPIFYSLAISLCYTICLVDYINGKLQQNQSLSYRLTALPSVAMSLLTGYLICISSMQYGSDFVELLRIVEIKGKLQCRGQRPLDYFSGFVATLSFVSSLLHVIQYVLLYPGGSTWDTFLATGPEWDQLLALGTKLFGFLRDGMSLSALCFLIIFGKGIVSNFELLCKEISDCCRSTIVQTYQGILPVIGSKAEETPALTLQVHSLGDTELAELFLLQKVSFEIYSKIGGVFTFALVAEIGTWLFYVVCAVLFNIEDPNLSFSFPTRIRQAIVVVLVLVTIAELGHQIGSQVLPENA